MPLFALECRLPLAIPVNRILVIIVMRTSSSLTVGPVLLLVGLSAAGTACNSGPATPSGSGPYTLTGSVRARTSLEPVAGANVEATFEQTNGVYKTVSVAADVNGEFSIANLKNYVTLNISKTGFYPGIVTFMLDRDQRANVLMDLAAPLLPEGGDLILGQTIHSTIGPTDPKCDPQLDSRSPCRIFGFTAEETRTYRFAFYQSGRCGELELHVIGQDGRRTLGSGRNTWTLDANLEAGRSYVLRVMAYYDCEWFELTVR
jgi:hypothetical protein